MKWILFWIIQSLLVFHCLAQNTTESKSHAAIISESQKWRLAENIWSYNHYKTGKNDKPALNFDLMNSWTHLGQYPEEDISISDDGKYFSYSVYQGLDYPYLKRDSIIIQATSNSWRIAFDDAKPGVFSVYGKMFIFECGKGLCLLQTDSHHQELISDVISFKLSSKVNAKWLAYLNRSNDLIVRNLISGEQKNYTNVSSFDFEPSKEWLICQLRSGELALYSLNSEKVFLFPNAKNYSIHESGKYLLFTTIDSTKHQKIENVNYVNLSSGLASTIWDTTEFSARVSNYKFDESGKQIVFSVSPTNINQNEPAVSENSIWYWKQGMGNAELKVNNNRVSSISHFYIQDDPEFTDDGSYIQFSFQSQSNPKTVDSNLVSIDVWDYKDKLLQLTQMKQIKEGDEKKIKAVLNIETGRIVKLSSEDEILKLIKGDYAVITKNANLIYGDRFWEDKIDTVARMKWLISLKDGSRQLLPTKSENIWFSPNGNFLVYFDVQQGGHYFSYNLKTKHLVKISLGVPDYLLAEKKEYRFDEGEPENLVGIAHWLEDEDGVVVYDNYDIWKLDLAGKKKPNNLTNGFGYKNKIIFSLMNVDRVGMPNRIGFMSGDVLLLNAFNTESKYNGFYKKNLDATGNPKMLYMQPCLITKGLKGSNVQDYGLMTPVKGECSNTSIVKRQTVTDAPNYFLTNDFKSFKRLTNQQPHKEYNWVSIESHSFKQLDGTMCQGLLYKPENFDPSRKYPVIISFYLAHSGGRYQYLVPNFIESPNIWQNPAWLVSLGYLVFRPGIYFVKGQWGPSTVNTIEGSANYLSHFSYVDDKHIAACGHSNSGRFGNYLLGHSHQFAAMSVGSGTTDVVNLALSINDEGGNLKDFERIAAGSGLGNLWKNKASWIDQTSVLSADKVKAPVLLFYNKKDGVPIEQGAQMFTALRRLEKKSWWLQYDNGGHTVSGPSARDFTIRTTQFYDHYLKCAPAPRWMTGGIPAALKQVEARLELDPEGNCALENASTISVKDFPNQKRCAICEAWNKQFKRNPTMFEKPISEWALDNDIKLEMDANETKRYSENKKGWEVHVRENNEKLRVKVKE